MELFMVAFSFVRHFGRLCAFLTPSGSFSLNFSLAKHVYINDFGAWWILCFGQAFVNTFLLS
jgi:hypothetical protein